MPSNPRTTTLRAVALRAGGPDDGRPVPAEGEGGGGPEAELQEFPAVDHVFFPAGANGSPVPMSERPSMWAGGLSRRAPGRWGPRP